MFRTLTLTVDTTNMTPEQLLRVNSLAEQIQQIEAEAAPDSQDHRQTPGAAANGPCVVTLRERALSLTREIWSQDSAVKQPIRQMLTARNAAKVQDLNDEDLPQYIAALNELMASLSEPDSIPVR